MVIRRFFAPFALAVSLLLGTVVLPAVQASDAEAIVCTAELWEHGVNNGRKVTLSGQGYWINLAGFGFDNITSAFRLTGHCQFIFADGAGGAGYWWRYTVTNQITAYSLSTANDRFSSLLIRFW